VFEDTLSKVDIWESAHPHVNSSNAEIINYHLKFGIRAKYIIYRMKEKSRKREIIAKIPVSKPSYMHSFSITENYIILTEYPFVVDPLAPLLSGKGFIQNYSWKPELGTRFTVVNK